MKHLANSKQRRASESSLEILTEELPHLSGHLLLVRLKSGGMAAILDDDHALLRGTGFEIALSFFERNGEIGSAVDKEDRLLRFFQMVY